MREIFGVHIDFCYFRVIARIDTNTGEPRVGSLCVSEIELATEIVVVFDRATGVAAGIRYGRQSINCVVVVEFRRIPKPVR